MSWFHASGICLARGAVTRPLSFYGLSQTMRTFATTVEKNSTSSPITVTRIAGGCGAEVSGVDLAKDLDKPEVVNAVQQALLDNLVIFFHNQGHLTPSDFLAATKKFGQPQRYPMVSGLAEHPEITQVLKREHEKTNFGGVWHSDTTYLEHPPKATILLARELPLFGGDTAFANQYLAYESLSDGLKQSLEGLRAISSSAKAEVTKTREDRVKEDSGSPAADLAPLESSHPIVRTHPETKRKALYVNVAHTTQVEGWTEEESKPLLDYLFQHQVKAEFTCRFKWQDGSLAFWDNRCVQHNPINDYHGYKRLMHRITLQGDLPR